MHQDNYLYSMSAEREKQIWSEAIFVFDSSALLDFYFLPAKTREKIFNELFTNPLKDRLWIPSHVQYEYNKNRDKIIKKPINENYKPLKDDNLNQIKKSVKEIENKVNDLKNKTKKDDKHPHLAQLEIDNYLAKVKEFNELTLAFDDSVIKQIQSVENEINKLPDDDDVLNAVKTLFLVGRYYTFSEVLGITEEGKHRFEFKIPPGYEDLDDKEKKGTQIFGDLIIWKQVIEFAKETKKPIILICNDLKEDWCYVDKSTNEKRIASPREELVKEIYDAAGVEFWMYNQAQFLYNANKYFDAKIEKQSIADLAQVITTKTTSADEIVIDCDKCEVRNHYDRDVLEMDFESVGSDERSMGTETEYQASEYVECENCENEIQITFHVWEYPVGAHNYDEVIVEGGTLVSCFDFTIDFHDQSDYEPDDESYYESDEETDSGRCSKCGNSIDNDNSTGICQNCEDEYNG